MSNRLGKPVGPTPRCIFCGGQGLSGEHLWSKWMAPFVPKTPHDQSMEAWHKFTPRMEAVSATYKSARGHTTTRKLRRVCRKCNNGWMSFLDNAARPLLLPMMSGASVSLRRADQELIARWIMMKCMVFENNDRADAVTTAEQRQEFMRSRTIPGFTRINLFWCGEEPWRWQFHRHSAALDSPASALHPRAKNTHAFTVGVGDLVFFALQSFAADIEFRFEDGDSRRLWPVADEFLGWPPAVRAHPITIERVAGNFGQFLLGLGVADS